MLINSIFSVQFFIALIKLIFMYRQYLTDPLLYLSEINKITILGYTPQIDLQYIVWWVHIYWTCIYTTPNILEFINILQAFITSKENAKKRLTRTHAPRGNQEKKRKKEALRFHRWEKDQRVIMLTLSLTFFFFFFFL